MIRNAADVPRNVIVRPSPSVYDSHYMAYRYEEHTKYHGVDAGVQRSLLHERSIQESLVRNLESISDWDHLLVDVLHRIGTVDRSKTESQ
jgi:hypothetical protein